MSLDGVQSKGSVWSEFLEESDEINIQMITSKKKWNNFKEKLTNYADAVLELEDESSEAKDEKVELLGNELSKDDESQLRDLVVTLSSIVNKWCGLYKGFKGKKPLHLDQIKPCCIFSFYGIILKAIYSTNNHSYSSKLWLTYLKLIRKEWNEKRSFNWYRVFVKHRLRLEYANGYHSKPYRKLQCLAAIAFLHEKARAITDAETSLAAQEKLNENSEVDTSALTENLKTEEFDVDPNAEENDELEEEIEMQHENIFDYPLMLTCDFGQVPDENFRQYTEPLVALVLNT